MLSGITCGVLALLVPRVNLVNHSATRLARQQPPSFLKKLVERASLVPSPESDDGAEIASTATLDRALEDRLLSEREGDELVDLVLHSGLSVETLHRLHEAVPAAPGGGRPGQRHCYHCQRTPTEQRDLQQVARLLGIGEGGLDEILSSARARLGTRITAAANPPAERPSWQGQRVWFTETLRSRYQGEAISREFAEELARQAGLEPIVGVTKKLNILAVADLETMSGKAKKAQQYGVRILHEPVFWKLLGVTVE